MKRLISSLAVACLTLFACNHARAQLDLTGTIVLAEQGGTFDAGNLSTLGATPFAQDVLGGGGFAAHQIAHLNDGVYGNGNSWIGEAPTTFAGIAFPAAQTVASFAFGRDNTGGFFDRDEGLYTLQWTSSAAPGAATGDTGDASTGWQTIGTLNYGPAPAPGTNYTNPSIRHRFNFDPVLGATGMRLIVPLGGIGGGTAIDELEFYATAGAVMPPPVALVTTPVAGLTLSWDGSDGAFFDQNPPPGGAQAPANLARSGTAFGSSEFGGGGVHLIANVNDGTYGNSNSWISNFSAGDPNPTIGIDLGGLHFIDSFAFGRDNGNGAFDDSFAGTDCCGGQADDRSLGLYTIQFTQNGVDWMDLGTIDYRFREDAVPGGGFTEYLRHGFDVGLDGGGRLQASGLRILVPNNGIAIDELEIYGQPVPEPSGALLLVLGCAGFLIRRRR